MGSQGRFGEQGRRFGEPGQEGRQGQGAGQTRMGSQGSRGGRTRCCQAPEEPACLLLTGTKPLCAVPGQPRAAQGCGRGGAALVARGDIQGGTSTQAGAGTAQPGAPKAPEPSAHPRSSPGAGAELREPQLRRKSACSSLPCTLPRLDWGWRQPEPPLLRAICSPRHGTSSFQLCSGPRRWNKGSIFIWLPGLSSWMAAAGTAGLGSISASRKCH